MSSKVSLIIRNAAGIAVFVGGWICVTGIQNGDDFFSIAGFLFALGALFVWMWDQDAKRGKKSFWPQYEY